MIYKKTNPNAKLYALEGYEPNVSLLRNMGVMAILHNLKEINFLLR